MDPSGYTTLTRQTGLMREMQAIAHNIANTATTGYRQEGNVSRGWLRSPRVSRMMVPS